MNKTEIAKHDMVRLRPGLTIEEMVDKKWLLHKEDVLHLLANSPEKPREVIAVWHKRSVPSNQKIDVAELLVEEETTMIPCEFLEQGALYFDVRRTKWWEFNDVRWAWGLHELSDYHGRASSEFTPLPNGYHGDSGNYTSEAYTTEKPTPLKIIDGKVY